MSHLNRNFENFEDIKDDDKDIKKAIKLSLLSKYSFIFLKHIEKENF